jgi:RHS repeat-associated protein
MLNSQTKEGGNKEASTDKSGVAAPSISLPKGGGAIRGIGEKFGANPVTGTGSMTVPIATSPGRSGFGPQLSLSYDSGAGNGPFGFGWDLSLPSIKRKTDKGLPKYQDAIESDVFILSGAEDLVPVFKTNPTTGEFVKDAKGIFIYDESPRDGYLIRRYSPRIEGLFARIERWTSQTDGDVHWRSISKDNITTWYGKTEGSRIANPEDASQFFSWLICQSYDDKGNAIVYEYAAENSDNVNLAQPQESNRGDADSKLRTSQRYLKRIKYGNRTPNRDADWNATDPTQLPDLTWMFEVVFDYDDGHYTEAAPDSEGRVIAQPVLLPPASAKWPVRLDPFSTYRAGFEVRTYRLCRRVLMFHHFPNELGTPDYLVRSTEFTYDQSPIASFITEVTQSGYVRQPNESYLKKSLPPLAFEYSQAVISEEIQIVDPQSLENLPVGADGLQYQWLDLDGEGLQGVLSQQQDGWYYKRNRSPISVVKENGKEKVVAQFDPLVQVSAHPSIAEGMSARHQFLDLAGDGQLDVAQFETPVSGFYERTHDERWDSFVPFGSVPNLFWNDPNLKFVDLTGDGHADIFITENDAFTWYPSLAEEGFGTAIRIPKPRDEEEGPAVVFADGTQAIFVADMSGDGLTDIVRIRNGEVCYWPNLGYGKFGAKVTMDNSPWFDPNDIFDQRRIRLADIDGAGVTDIIYLGVDGARLYFNQSGNGWSEPKKLDVFPRVDSLTSVQAVDLLGNGTACLVWTSPLPGDASQPMRYIDLMGGQKPHLLVKTVNNLGAETRVDYAPSTKFYLQDKLDGKPWITKLPFPVHVVERLETHDFISRNRFVTHYEYHHGYFDGVEREFRGFGLVEQVDTEEFAALTASGAPLAPANGGEGQGDGAFAANIDAASHVPPVRTKTWFHTGVYFEGGRISRHFEEEYYHEGDESEDVPGLTDEQLEAMLLQDTTLPNTVKVPEGTSLPWTLSADEEREACRALKGSVLRREIFARDGSEEEDRPYSVTEQNYTLELLQPQGENKHAVFFAHPRESLDFHYERKLVDVVGATRADPRVTHAMTLEVDGYGDVLRSVAIGYRRRDLPGVDEPEQKQTHLTLTVNRFANRGNEQDWYRVGLPVESRTYEVVKPPEPTIIDTRIDLFRFDEVTELMTGIFPLNQTAPDGGKTWPHEKWDWSTNATNAPSDTRLRLIEHVRTRYRLDDLTGPLDLGQIESLAVPFESYKLALTPELAQQMFVDSGKLTAVAMNSLLTDEGKYVHSEGDANWWIPSGRMFYSPGSNDTAAEELAHARIHFFLPHRYRDPFYTDQFNTETVVTYDDHKLLMVETRDAVDNTVTAQHDYRVLQSKRITDPNGNRSEVAFDTLGMVAGTAVMGKPLPAPVEGDSLDGFDADLTQAETDAFYDADDPHVPAPNLLKSATTRIIYDLDRFRRTQQDHPDDPELWLPPYAATLARETHVSDPLPPGGLKIQISFSYSDGFGREIQKKIQAEPGPLVKNGPVVTPRWVGSGWTIFNNKGKPVRQYEPFFSQLSENRHRFEFGVQVGVSPVLFYDPVERVVTTLHPNGTYEKVVFDPWQQKTYDVNDTVDLDPRTDPDIVSYVAEYFKQVAPQPSDWKTWLEQRGVDALNPPVDSPSLDPEKKAAVRTLPHRDTPTIAHFDTLGRTFLTIAHNRFERNKAVVEEGYRTRVELDIEGNQRAVRDAVVQNNDTLGRVVMRYDYDMLGNRTHQVSMEAGERWILNDVTGKPILAWDSRGFMRRMTYDQLRRPTGLFVTEKGTERLTERTVYGENQGDAKNHRTRVYQVFDAAGIVMSVEYDFKGNLRESTRDLLPISTSKQGANWAQNPAANDGTFTTRTTYDALSRPLTVTSPDGSVYRPTFNEANLLDKVEVSLRGAAVTAPFVTNIDYNAKGQRTLIHYANGAETTYEYDDQTFRLTHLKTTRAPDQNGFASQIFKNAATVQDLRYTYDPAGNITRIEDAALLVITHDNQLVAPVCDYTYDAIYRLIEATGREHIGQTAHDFNLQNRRDYDFAGLADFIAHPNNLQAMRNYKERYEYDGVGNFALMQHIANGGSWTRGYAYEEPSLLEPTKRSNRLTHSAVGNGFNFLETYTYTDAEGNDVHGCMTSINSMNMEWNFKDQLRKVDLGGGGTAYYVYDAGGQRTRKVIETQNGALSEERLYLGGFEIYRKFGANALVREALHVMDDKQRIALVETKTQEFGSPISEPQSLVRYQLGNHLGSATLELDIDGGLISYEEYHPYGTTAFQAMNSAAEVSLKQYRYTGKERDEETGLYYHGARYYAPWIRRWIAADPVGLRDGENLFVYSRNNPIGLKDVNGTQSCDPQTASCMPEDEALHNVNSGDPGDPRNYVNPLDAVDWAATQKMWKEQGLKDPEEIVADAVKNAKATATLNDAIRGLEQIRRERQEEREASLRNPVDPGHNFGDALGEPGKIVVEGLATGYALRGATLALRFATTRAELYAISEGVYSGGQVGEAGVQWGARTIGQGTVIAEEIASPWSLDAWGWQGRLARGDVIDMNYFGNNLGRFFPEIDVVARPDLLPEAPLIKSSKSLNPINSYERSGAVFDRVMRDAETVAQYSSRTHEGVTVTATADATRVLQVAVPARVSEQASAELIDAMIQSARIGVRLDIHRLW